MDYMGKEAICFKRKGREKDNNRPGYRQSELLFGMQRQQLSLTNYLCFYYFSSVKIVTGKQLVCCSLQ